MINAVLPASGSGDLVKRRVRHEAAVPVLLAVDLHGGKSRRQCTAGQYVLRFDPSISVIEVNRVPVRTFTDRAKASRRHG